MAINIFSWHFFLYIVIQFVLQSAFLLSAFVIKDYEFKPFFTKYARMYPNHKLPNIEFLQWFIGFAEGCFTVAKRGDLQFVVTTEDVNVLNKEQFRFW